MSSGRCAWCNREIAGRKRAYCNQQCQSAAKANRYQRRHDERRLEAWKSWVKTP